MQTVCKQAQSYGDEKKITIGKTKCPFDFQNWDVYRRSVGLVKVCREVALENQSTGIKGFTDQLTRVSLSIVLNLAEGYSRYGKKEKLNYFRTAKGSLFECVACMDVLQRPDCIEAIKYK